MAVLDDSTRNQFRRAFDAVRIPAILGDSAGVIWDDPVRKVGYARVRIKSAAGYTLPAVVRLGMNCVVPPVPGQSIYLGYENGEQVIKGANVVGQIASGVNPVYNNPAKLPEQLFIPTTAIVPLSSAPTSPLSASVWLASLVYLEDRTVRLFYASDDGGSGTPKGKVDLTSSIPAAGNHGLVALWLKSDQTVEVAASTAQTLDVPIDLTDLQECVDASSAGSMPSLVYLLKDAQTTVSQSDVWADFRQFINNSSTIYTRALFSQTASATVASTVTETTLTAAGVGTLTLPAKYLRAGTTIRLEASGFLSDTGTPNLNVRFKLGSTTICSTGAVALAGTISNNLWRVVVDLVCRTIGASGTVIAQGRFEYDESTHAGTTEGMVSTATTTIDTTATQAVTLTVEWGTASASNTITCTNLTLEALR